SRPHTWPTHPPAWRRFFAFSANRQGWPQPRRRQPKRRYKISISVPSEIGSASVAKCSTGPIDNCRRKRRTTRGTRAKFACPRTHGRGVGEVCFVIQHPETRKSVTQSTLSEAFGLSGR